jgi:alpha-galactosidase
MRRVSRLISVLLTVLVCISGEIWAGEVYEPEAPEPYILTPKASAAPRINGAKVFGVRPGSPFVFTIPATGEHPMSFGAEGLPEGLGLDGKTGRITGRVDKAGTYVVKLKAVNSLGEGRRELRIVVGERISLTPPMGWNSWNCWGKSVTAEKVLASARGMADSGLINHGWTYVNIDDMWQGSRGGKFNGIEGNEKFADMQGLCDAVHALGLKIGVYSTPWVTSYGGCVGGSSDHEDGSWDPNVEGKDGNRFGKYSFITNDARQWAAWGVDYVKYDWKPNDVPHVEEIAGALRACGRDIIFSMSNAAPFEKVRSFAKSANSWRTTGDIKDAWTTHPKTPRKAQGVADFMDGHDKWRPYAGPGHWNDPDMLVVGKVGWGPELHASQLTPDEQYTHISLWCLWSAPLLLGCPLDDLDAFTLGLLTNDEVLGVNQDALGIQAGLIRRSGEVEVWGKDMEDGSKAVGLFNRNADESRVVSVSWSEVGIGGRKNVRDLWRQRDIGEYEKEFSAKVRPHGVVLIRIGPVPAGGR